ncbi:MAG: transglutaminase domain-containing protein [Bdellovibrionota bacterium]
MLLIFIVQAQCLYAVEFVHESELPKQVIEVKKAETLKEIEKLKSEFFFFESNRSRLLIPLYYNLGNYNYYLDDVPASLESYEQAMALNPYTNTPEVFNIVSENMAFVYEQRALRTQVLASPELPQKELIALDPERLITKEVFTDLDFDLNKADEILTLDIEFPIFVIDSNSKTTAQGAAALKSSFLNSLDIKMSPQELKDRKVELEAKFTEREKIKEKKEEAKDESMREQANSPEAVALADEMKAWEPGEQAPVGSDLQNETNPGMNEMYDERDYFKLVPFEGREYATSFFNHFDHSGGKWEGMAFGQMSVPEKSFEWDDSKPEVLVQGYMRNTHKGERLAFILLAIREGYSVDLNSIRFESSSIKSYQLRRSKTGSYALLVKGENLEDSRFTYKLKKLLKAVDAESHVVEEDTQTIVTQIPEAIRSELDPYIAVLKDSEAKAKAIEAYILRRAIYTDNNDPMAREITAFINQAKDTQTRFKQMARVFLQDKDLGFPPSLLGSGMNCDLWSDFFIALSRYYKVPTRKVVGFYNRFPRDEFLNGSEAHAWVSVWSEKKGHWVWLEPTPRGGLSDEQQDRIGDDDLNRELAGLEWISALREEKEDIPQNDNADEPVKDDPINSFDWIRYQDPKGEREYTPEEREMFNKALDEYTRMENEYRESRKLKKNTPSEKLFEAMNVRNAMLEEEAAKTGSFQQAVKIFNVLSTKKVLSEPEKNFISRYKNSRNALIKQAQQLVTHPKHDPSVDPYLFSTEIMHALALIESVVKFDTDENTGLYARLIESAEEQLTKVKAEALFEVVAQNEDFHVVLANKALYLARNDSFSLERVDLDVSAYSSFVLGALTPDAKHMAFVVKVGDELQLIRDGKRVPLKLSDPNYMTFADEAGGRLILRAEKVQRLRRKSMMIFFHSRELMSKNL